MQVVRRSVLAWLVLVGTLASAAGCEHDVLQMRASYELDAARSAADAIARQLRALPGVLDAKVELAPQLAPRLADEPAAKARASVLLRVDPSAAPIDVAAVQRLVAGATRDLRVEAVSVVLVPHQSPPTTKPLAHVGPFEVAGESADALRWTLVTLLCVQALLALTLWLRVARARRERALAEHGAPPAS